MVLCKKTKTGKGASHKECLTIQDHEEMSMIDALFNEIKAKRISEQKDEVDRSTVELTDRSPVDDLSETPTQVLTEPVAEVPQPQAAN